MSDILKAENKALLGRATTADINLGREQIAHEELVEMLRGITQCGFNNQWCMDKLETFIGNKSIRSYHPCEDCSCPVREGEDICEWCEAEQKGTA